MMPSRPPDLHCMHAGGKTERGKRRRRKQSGVASSPDRVRGREAFFLVRREGEKSYKRGDNNAAVVLDGKKPR